MKVEVTKEEIIFKFPLCSFIVPKEENFIEYAINDSSKTTGLPAFLVVMPSKYKTNGIGKLHVFFLYVLSMVSKLSLNRNVSPLTLYENRIPRFIIETRKKIAESLDLLNENGYDVNETMQNFNKLINEPIDKKFIPGTIERKKDRLALMSIIFILFEGVFSFIFFSGSKNTLNDLSIFVLISILFFVFCLIFYYLIRSK